MSSLFDLESPWMRFLGNVYEVMVAGMLWVICSVPIVTIGASTAALYHVTLQLVRGEGGYTVRSFFSSLKQNFKQGTQTWLLFFACLVVLLCDMYYGMYLMDGSLVLKRGVLVAGLALLGVWISIVLYVFPILAMFRNTTRQTIRLAFFMAVGCCGYTILMIVIDLILFYVCLKALPVLWPALAAWVNSYFLNKIFKKYELGK